MSELATVYVRRHLLIGVNRTKGLILMVLADVADDSGRSKMTQPMVATDINAGLSTVKRSMQAMQRDKIIVKGGGRSYVIVGVVDHNILTCDHVECAAEAEALRRGQYSARKRMLAAERARRAREKRKREAASERP